MFQGLLLAGIVLLNAPPLAPRELVNVELLRPTVFPGRTLPPGWYVFYIGQSVGGQALIDIHTGDGSALLVTCLTIESELPKSAMLDVATYPGTAPPVMRVWFPAGSQSGYEFVYSAAEAWKIFEQSAVSVPFTPARTFTHELIGTYEVRRTGSDPIPSSTAGTSGADHLVAARLLIASRMTSGNAEETGRLRVFDQQLADIAKDYRGGRNIDEKLTRLSQLLDNALLRPANTDRSAVQALERIHAHIEAFQRAIAAR